MKWQRAKYVVRNQYVTIGKEMWVEVSRPEVRPDFDEDVARKVAVKRVEPSYLTNLVRDDGRRITVVAAAVELLSPDDPNNVTDDPPIIPWGEYCK